MADLVNWTGVVGGIVGAITGVLGVVVSVVTYRRVSFLERTNVRHDALVEHDKVSQSVRDLKELLPQALKSRRNIASANGVYRSSMMQTIEEQHAADTAAVAQLEADSNKIDPQGFSAMEYEQLMEQLTEIKKLQRKVDGLRQKYDDSMNSDRKDVDRLRADRRAVEAAKISRPDNH